MTKKERERLEAAERSAKELRALRWSDYPDTPDIEPPSGFLSFVNGWFYNPYIGAGDGPRAYPAWTEGGRHGTGHRIEGGPRSGGQQGGTRLYSTKLRALWALRRNLERNFARILANVDEMIEDAARDQG